MTSEHIKFKQNNGKLIETYEPSSDQKYLSYKLHSLDQAKEIVEQAHQAFLSWKTTSLEERSKVISQMGSVLERNKKTLCEMMAHQMGKPVSLGEDEVDLCMGICRFTAKNGPKELQDEEKELQDGSRGIITYQPLGVILGMQPWNFPLYQCLRYSIATIMAGNTTVFKHAAICFEMAEKIKDMFEEAGLPKSVFSPIYLEDEEADKLISHEKVRGVSFTGSAKGGKIVAKMAGENLKKSVMELGGSDPYIVLKDCDLDKVIKTCVTGRIYNTGQTCVNAKRFLIEKDIYDEFKKRFVEAMEDVRYGDPLDSRSKMGPLARKDLRDNLHDQVEETLAKGAKLLCGGKIPSEKGYYYPATVLEDIPEDSPAYKDELFGPVASLFKVNDEQEAIKIANDHRYGLGGGVFSGDKEKALELARKIETGMVNINSFGAAQPEMPFGGVKESGFGREHGGFGLKEFVNIKSIVEGK